MAALPKEGTMPLKYDEKTEVVAIVRQIVKEEIALARKTVKPAIKPEVKIEPIAEKFVKKEVK